MLDAVMGVADGEQAELRATVLNEAADEVEADARARHNRSYSDNRIFEWKGARAAAARLRRLAAEAQQPTPDEAEETTP